MNKNIYIKKMDKSKIPLLRDPWFGNIYFENLYKNCCQLEFNPDNTVDLYDFNTGKHLMHF